jgi:membrane-bound lytic murein transglycosylase A
MSRQQCTKIICGLLLVFLWGCPRQPPKVPEKGPAFERITASEIPRFDDDLDSRSLKTAIEKSLSFYERVPADRTYPLGDMQIRAEVLKASLLHFLKLLEKGQTDPVSIAQAFDVYRANSAEPLAKPLVTGYYEPVLEGRLEREEQFSHPLYGLPPDLVTIELAAFDPDRFSTERLIGWLRGNRVVPYHTRDEIDGKKKLEQSGLQLVWLRDPVDVFFLHVQGSGRIQLPGGVSRQVGYAGSNGRRYRSIGKYLIEKGYMTSSEVTLQAIRAYLREHREARDEILCYNESYVFFRWVEEGPVGSLSVVLTEGRSIATDVRYHPKGALAFLETEKPRFDLNNQIVGWEPLHRWVLNQDTGGAIKGIGRVDLFCGSGEAAERIAGRLKHPGKLYFLIKREEAGN